MEEQDSTPPDIGLLLYDTLPDDFEEGVTDNLEREGLTVKVVRIPAGPFAGIELYLPAAAMLFVGTAYFTGFVQKAGEDHYELLKQAAQKLWQRTSRLRATPIASDPGKISNTSFSLTYAIMGAVRPGLHFKFILKTEIDVAEADEGIRAFLELLRDIHAGNISEENMSSLLNYRPVGGTVLVTFDSKTRRIVPVDAFDRT